MSSPCGQGFFLIRPLLNVHICKYSHSKQLILLKCVPNNKSGKSNGTIHESLCSTPFGSLHRFNSNIA
uniref:Uncharacterized protein n=1 Tax=Arundo donax TaxID=35708 RepID=A0A0A9BJ65_ARUDO